jgi:Fe2+ transport system protein FeoA
VTASGEFTTVSSAPSGVPLVISDIQSGTYKRRLFSLGLSEGSTVVKHESDISLRAIRIRGENRDAVINGETAARLIVHSDDGGMLPMLDLETGVCGHVEGIAAGDDIARLMETLGFQENDRVEKVRDLPPMEYLVTVNRKDRMRLTEGQCALLWGRNEPGEDLQFLLSDLGRPFRVDVVLGGAFGQDILQSTGITVGDSLEVVEVTPGDSIGIPREKALVLTTHEGLRVYLGKMEGEWIVVAPAM